jgi:hypothetical protein
MDFGSHIVTPVSLGLKDSLNPYAISVGMMFLMLLAGAGLTARRIIRIGIPFILIFPAIIFMGMFGGFDIWLEWAFVQNFLWFLSLGVAVLFFGVGSRIFRDWWKVAYQSADEKAAVRIPVFLKADCDAADDGLHGQEKGQERIGIIFLSVILGVFGALWNSLWPPEYYVYVMYSSIVSSGIPGLAVLFFALYSLGYISFFVLIWLTVLFTHRSKIVVKFLVDRISIVRAASSAVFISLGFGLVYLSVFIKHS